MITADQCKRIRDETFVSQVEFHSELASTNDVAMERSAEGKLPKPLLVVTGSQTAGRGRGANRWWSSKGALTFSLLLDSAPTSTSLPISLAVGIAVCDTVQALTGESAFRLKWPNDVYHSGRKIAGVLIERPSQMSGDLVVGIGLNVNNSMESAPEEIASIATSLCDVSGRIYELDTVLVHLISQLEQIMGMEPSQLHDRWQQLCMLTDKDVVVNAGNQQCAGRCLGIDENGALIVETLKGQEKCVSGVVTSFR